MPARANSFYNAKQITVFFFFFTINVANIEVYNDKMTEVSQSDILGKFVIKIAFL
jgi:hypothetical protein